MFNLIRQDIENGGGVGVLDPHGDLIDRILGFIPESRIDDVVLVDPSDADFPIGFNILPTQVFGNLAHCRCGHKMYVRSNNPKYVCRACKNKIPIVDLEGIFREELKGFFANRDRIAEHLHNARENLSEKETLLAAHQKKIQGIREDMTRTHRLYLDGGVTSQGFSQFYKPAEEQLNQLTAELPKLQAEVDFLKVNDLSADAVLAEAETLYDRWPKLTRDDKRKIAESIVEKIVIGDGEIDITLSCLPSSEELTKSQQRLRRQG